MFDQGVAFASAARTASPTAVVVPIAPDAHTLEVAIHVSAFALTPSVVFNIDFPDGEGGWVSRLASAAVTGTGDPALRIGLSVANTANVSLPAALPSAVRIRPVHGDTDSITYSVSYWMRG